MLLGRCLAVACLLLERRPCPWVAFGASLFGVSFLATDFAVHGQGTKVRGPTFVVLLTIKFATHGQGAKVRGPTFVSHLTICATHGQGAKVRDPLFDQFLPILAILESQF